ncbi:hypothetical protein KRE40_02555 [Elizabethkingia meningoseptica]|uniref:GLPGLI family protein n=1 Tax=Elizabethkingia meningoseptica TaxID=238 RepID=A0A1V3U368_ELIME|nr:MULTISPECIES: hypothetical protein [Elizabethkingia]AQX12856.1 hypothetical protein BBD35_10950 [Elizabethkingia meningoseptica]MBG0514377.1 hypothetical protein [Elizabethkingia meningoseptica]MCL1674369.1 hypothetical protein [Elizabethkingia meningoseptica]MCL1687243.1 hypothetical protein [Elizabethkingia meningoseptica]MDE5430876.1 hypothetical protein [Elizabethkingia meningoseptica]
MQKLIFIFFIGLAFNIQAQELSVYTQVNVCKQEGMADKGNFRMLGDQKFLSIIKGFEKEIKNMNNGYSDYYRLYNIPGGIKATDLSVYLIPKSIVADKQKAKNDYRVVGDKRTLWVYYNLKTKKISKPRSFMLTPEY